MARAQSGEIMLSKRAGAREEAGARCESSPLSCGSFETWRLMRRKGKQCASGGGHTARSYGACMIFVGRSQSRAADCWGGAAAEDLS